MSATVDPLTPIPARPEGSPPPPPGPAPEDAGSQALADALRSSFAIVKVIMVLLVIVFFASGVFTVPSQERAVVLRFGRPVGTGKDQLLGPGLHWSFPYPIDEIVHIPFSTVQTVTSTAGWYALAPGEEDNENAEPGTVSLNPAVDGYTLTSDGNIIHARVVLRYQIDDPLAYALNFADASNLLQNALDNALIHASTQFTVDQAIRGDVLGFQERVRSEVSDAIHDQKLGVTIQSVALHSIPPRQVRRAFNEVINADAKRSQDRSEAEAYASSNITTAAGEADVIVKTSQAEKLQLVQILAAEAKYFTNVLPQYRQDPSLLLTRLQTETFRRILTNAQFKVFRLDNGERSMRIQVAPEPAKPAGTAEEK